RDERIMALMRERDDLGKRTRAIETERPIPATVTVEPASTRGLEVRLGAIRRVRCPCPSSGAGMARTAGHPSPS
ncbi:hypothetical protein MKL09_04025, partial [Methylobacterium sp. J-048]|uniref:hypothetical protein n=1 Tax=Methylobacterium sp. J-048 TaxID=2836635 RepID=UPI001FBB9E4C